MGGSNWWSIPAWPPRAVTGRMERANLALAHRAPAVFGRFVGAPVVHAAMCGAIDCPMPPTPGVRYRGRLEGGALVTDASGRVLAHRGVEEGSGVGLADVEIRRSTPLDEIPDRFWLHRRQAMAVWAWNAQRLHGRRWYARHVRGRPALELERAATA